MSTLILCPSRGRPQKAAELLTTFTKTVRSRKTNLVVLVDEDDPTLDDYLEILPSANVEVNESIGSMVLALNAAATLHAAINVYDYLGFVGDDHRFRTNGWDKTFEAKLTESGGGFAYGNDLYQGANLPTHVVMNASIVLALGWMALPTCKHLYVDNVWRTLGSATDRLFYFPEVIIEHLHFYAGKAEMDEGYARVNSPEMNDHDHTAFDAWVRDQSAGDVETIKRILAL